jgi:hypothetical protein
MNFDCVFQTVDFKYVGMCSKAAQPICVLEDYFPKSGIIPYVTAGGPDRAGDLFAVLESPEQIRQQLEKIRAEEDSK